MLGMQSDFKLTPPGPGEGDLAQAQALLTKIRTLADSRRSRRPTLEAMSFRVEPRVHHELKKLVEHLDPLSQSDILNGLLEIQIPLLKMLVGNEVSPAANLLASLDPARQQQIVGLLNSLSEVFQRTGT
jgi:hypothetical protein